MSLLNDLRSNSSSKVSHHVSSCTERSFALVLRRRNRIDTSSGDRQIREASAMRLPESQRCVVHVLKVDNCRGRIRDFVSFLVKSIIAVRKQHCSALLFLAERRVFCPPVMPPFLSCLVVLYLVPVPCCSISNCRVLCTPGAKMLQRSAIMSVWPSTFRPRTLQDPDKAAISLGSLVRIEFPVSAYWFSAHVTSVSPGEEFPDFRPHISTNRPNSLHAVFSVIK